MFDLQLLENNPNTPPFYLTLITVLSAFFLSSLVAITYEFTTKSIHKKAYFLQSLSLISIVAATVMQAIGDSVATGLGMLGALSIIRFRTTLTDPRNITFMFASLAIGIACGVFGLSIALIGTIVFCLAAIVLRFSPLNNPVEIIGKLSLRLPSSPQQQATFEKKLADCCRSYELDTLRFIRARTKKVTDDSGAVHIREIRGSLQELQYSFCLKNDSNVSYLTSQLEAVEGVRNLRIRFENQPPRL
ncbi:MAG: DUF4956 domain-containing protein [Bacteroidota bacterium]